MKVTKHKIDPRKQFELNGATFCLIGQNNKGHLLYAKFKNQTSRDVGMLCGFYVDNGRQLNEIDITKLTHEDFKEQKGKATHPQVRKLRESVNTVRRRDVPPNNRNRKV